MIDWYRLVKYLLLYSSEAFQYTEIPATKHLSISFGKGVIKVYELLIGQRGMHCFVLAFMIFISVAEPSFDDVLLPFSTRQDSTAKTHFLSKAHVRLRMAWRGTTKPKGGHRQRVPGRALYCSLAPGWWMRVVMRCYKMTPTQSPCQKPQNVSVTFWRRPSNI